MAWVTQSSGLKVCEEADTRAERLTATAFEGDVILRCKWEDRFKVMYDIYMNNVSYPDVENCLISSFGVSPMKGAQPYANLEAPDDNIIQYTEALISCKFSTIEATSDKLYIETLEPTVQGMRMSPENFLWEDDSQVRAAEAPSRQIHQWVYTVHWIQQEKIPGIFFDFPGSVNSQKYNIARWNRDCEAETMLFTPGTSGRSFWMGDKNSPGDRKPKPGWDYTAKFLINETGWNKFYNASKAGVTIDADRWMGLKVKQSGGPPTGYTPYPLKSLVPLLLPESGPIGP